MHDLDLEDLLGQKLIIRTIIDWLNDSLRKNNIIFLEGPSGSGKTHIVEEVIKSWDNDLLNRKSLYLEGDLVNAERALFPFKIGLNKARKILSKQAIVKKGVSEMAKGIPYAGDFVSYLFNLIANNKINNEKESIDFLSSDEQEILLNINLYYKNSEFLLVIDNFQWWDSPSINLIKLIISGKLLDSLSFNKRMSVIFVVTEDQVNLTENNIHELIKKYNPLILKTEKIKKENFKLIFQLLGSKAVITTEIENLLYSLTDGHLELIKKIVQLTDSNEINNNEFFLLKNDLNEHSLKQEFIEKLLIQRLQLLGAEGTEIIKFLEYASIIGISFGYEEILCLSKGKSNRIKEIISKAREKSLINGDDTQNKFNHEVIREFFACRIGNKKSEYYRNFADCLRVLRPSEYFQRANLLFESGKIEDALLLYIIGCFKNSRDGLAIPAKIHSRIESFANDFNFYIYYSIMKESYSLFLSGEFEIVRKKIESIEDIYPVILLAEKYYLLSLCLSKNLNNEDLIESKNCLLEWDTLKNIESEIWVRIMLTLMSRYAHLDEYDQASMIEKRVMLLLVDRTRFDLSAQDGINILRRKASILHNGEIACLRTKASLDYFGHEDIPGIYRNPIQYYMSLANHAGNLIITGKFSESHEYSEYAISLQKLYPELIFPRMEVPINNFILSGYLSQKMSIIQCNDLFDALLMNIDNADKSILLRNNYAIIKALKGDLREAHNLFEELSMLLSKSSRKDNYYDYFVGINLSVIDFLLGEKTNALDIITNLYKKIPSIPDKQFLLRRHELLEGLFKTSDIMHPLDWNDYLLKKFPLRMRMGQ